METSLSFLSIYSTNRYIHGLVPTTNNVCLPDKLANANAHRGVATLLCVAGDSRLPTADDVHF